MPDELGRLQKGDELWLATDYKLMKARVSRVWSLHRTTLLAEERKVDLKTTCEGEFSESARWVESRRGYGVYGSSSVTGYLRESDAQAEFRIRRLNKRRYELSRWIDKAPVDVIEQICAIKDECKA